MALARTEVPVLIVGGSKVIVTKPEAARTIVAAVPHAQPQLAKGVDHTGPVERADKYNEVIAAFASALSAGTVAAR